MLRSGLLWFAQARWAAVQPAVLRSGLVSFGEADVCRGQAPCPSASLVCCGWSGCRGQPSAGELTGAPLRVRVRLRRRRLPEPLAAAEAV
jgi:hypothetical protein